MRTVIWGANGAMGQLLQKALGQEVCGLVSLDGEKGVARNAQELPDVKPEAVIDFSHHSAVAEVTAYAISQGCPRSSAPPATRKRSRPSFLPPRKKSRCSTPTI